MDQGGFKGRRARSACAAALLFVVGVLLSSCGGGGGGDGASYSISTNSVSFTATQGGSTPASQTVQLTVNSGTVYVATSQTGSEFSHNFIITGDTTGQIVITPFAPINAGTFIGTITVRGCSTETCTGPDVPGSPKIINVTYTVSGPPTLTSSLATVDFATTTGVLPAAKNLNLSLSTGSAAWTSSVQYLTGANGWLVRTPESGTLPQTISLSVNSAATPGTHTANVTFSAGGIDKVVPVSLTVNDPRVNFVSPYVGTTNVGGNVIIRGFGFSSTDLAVDFGGNAATSATFVSETEIHATYPPILAPGNYTVNVSNNGVPIPTTLATLVVVDPPAFPAETIVRPVGSGGLGNLIYDAERRALYLMDASQNRLRAYRFNDMTDTWDLDPAFVDAGGGGNHRVSLSPDGTELLMTAGLTMRRIDPETLGIIGNVDATPFLGLGGAHLNLIAFGNDGGAVGSAYAPLTGITLYRYDMLTQQFAALSTESSMTNRTIVASGDGDTLVLPTSEPLAPGFEKPLFTYDASLGTLTQRAVLNTGTENASVSRDGSRFILVNAPNSAQQVTTVYNASFTALGNLPADLRGFVISPDGSTAYAYFSGSGLVRKFDLNDPDGMGGFVEVGVGVAVSSPGSFFSRIAISPDGGTLFLAGNERLIVVPAPP
jgi:hypothetical protein